MDTHKVSSFVFPSILSLVLSLVRNGRLQALSVLCLDWLSQSRSPIGKPPHDVLGLLQEIMIYKCFKNKISLFSVDWVFLAF